MLKKIIDDQIVIVTFENGKTNSYTIDLLRELKTIIAEVNEKEELKGLIMTGSGRFFSSGFDLPMFLSFKNLDEVVAFFDEEERILLDLFMCKKPVVSAMNGHSAAAGLIFSMAADYRIIKNHPKIKIGMSEIKIGLPLSIAQAAVMRFGLNSDRCYRDVMFFGEMMDVTRAKEMGLVDEIVEEDMLLERAKQIVSLWIDTPGRPFIPLKYSMKREAARAIERSLREESWQEKLDCFFKADVRATLEFVQAGMEQR